MIKSFVSFYSFQSLFVEIRIHFNLILLSIQSNSRSFIKIVFNYDNIFEILLNRVIYVNSLRFSAIKINYCDIIRQTSTISRLEKI